MLVRPSAWQIRSKSNWCSGVDCFTNKTVFITSNNVIKSPSCVINFDGMFLNTVVEFKTPKMDERQIRSCPQLVRRADNTDIDIGTEPKSGIFESAIPSGVKSSLEAVCKISEILYSNIF